MEEKTEFDLQVKMNPRSRGAPWPGPRWSRAGSRRAREPAEVPGVREAQEVEAGRWQREQPGMEQ